MYSKIVKLSLLLFALFIISACASLSKSDCSKGDWASIGSNDARKGFVANVRLKKHQSACAKHKIAPNNKLYFSGYDNGLNQFCRRDSGYNFGVRGAKYLQTCPVAKQEIFLIGYIPGLEVAMDQLEGELDDLLFERDSVDRRLDSLLYRSHDKKHPKTKKHKKRISGLESRLDSIQSNISSKRSEFNNIRSWHARWIRVLNKR